MVSSTINRQWAALGSDERGGGMRIMKRGAAGLLAPRHRRVRQNRHRAVRIGDWRDVAILSYSSFAALLVASSTFAV